MAALNLRCASFILKASWQYWNRWYLPPARAPPSDIMQQPPKRVVNQSLSQAGTRESAQLCSLQERAWWHVRSGSLTPASNLAAMSLTVVGGASGMGLASHDSMSLRHSTPKTQRSGWLTAIGQSGEAPSTIGTTTGSTPSYRR